MRLTSHKVERWLAKWKRTLKLQDWEIKVALRSRDSLDGCDGKFDHTLARKYALIQMSESRTDPKHDVFYDPEQTLVHELIHIHFAPFQSNEDGSPEDIAQEQAVDSLATALITKERELEAMTKKCRALKTELATLKGSRKK